MSGMNKIAGLVPSVGNGDEIGIRAILEQSSASLGGDLQQMERTDPFARTEEKRAAGFEIQKTCRGNASIARNGGKSNAEILSLFPGFVEGGEHEALIIVLWGDILHIWVRG